MANLNRIILVGRLTADPEARSTNDGRPMAKFNLSVSRPQGGADLVDVVAWQQLAEAARDNLRKGKLVLVEGRIQIRTFDDQAGQKHWATEVVASHLQLLDSAPAAAPVPSGDVPADESESVVEDEVDLAGELPF